VSILISPSGFAGGGALAIHSAAWALSFYARLTYCQAELYLILKFKIFRLSTRSHVSYKLVLFISRRHGWGKPPWTYMWRLELMWQGMLMHMSMLCHSLRLLHMNLQVYHVCWSYAISHLPFETTSFLLLVTSAYRSQKSCKPCLQFAWELSTAQPKGYWCRLSFILLGVLWAGSASRGFPALPRYKRNSDAHEIRERIPFFRSAHLFKYALHL